MIRAIFSARNTRDVELRTTKTGIPYADLFLATNEYRNGKKYTTFAPCRAWRGVAEYIGKNVRKGDKVIVDTVFTQEEKEDGKVILDNYKFNIISIEKVSSSVSVAQKTTQPQASANPFGGAEEDDIPMDEIPF